MYDELTLTLAKNIISNEKVFNSYSSVEKMFIIMPLTHSETVKDCEYALKLLNKLIEATHKRKKLAEVVK